MSKARQIQVVVWDETGTALWSTAIPLPTEPATPDQAYEVAMQLAHVTELMVLDMGGHSIEHRRSELTTPVLKARALI